MNSCAPEGWAISTPLISIRHFIFAIITIKSTEIVTSTNGTSHMISERTTDGHLKPSNLSNEIYNLGILRSDMCTHHKRCFEFRKSVQYKANRWFVVYLFDETVWNKKLLLICFFKEESENQETVKEEIEETSMVEDRSEHKGSLFCIFFNNWR
jgi:hypothetical protein